MHDDYPTIHDKRATNKMGLETFWMDRNNVFDPAIDGLLKQLNDHAKERKKYAESLSDMQVNDPQRFIELQEEGDRIDIDLNKCEADAWMDVLYYEEQLTALAEMKIIHAFKIFEISVKRLVKGAFQIKSIKGFSYWDNLVSFLKDHNVDVRQLRTYAQVDELRQVNNTLKHDNEDLRGIRSIPEFKDVGQLYYDNLENFYTRVQDAPNLFMQELTQAIYIELYEFNEDKLNQIAIELANRMDKTDAIKLVEKIKTLYGNS